MECPVARRKTDWERSDTGHPLEFLAHVFEELGIGRVPVDGLFALLAAKLAPMPDDRFDGSALTLPVGSAPVGVLILTHLPIAPNPEHGRRLEQNAHEDQRFAGWKGVDVWFAHCLSPRRAKDRRARHLNHLNAREKSDQRHPT
jgi:hypothetical protein